MIHCTLGKIVIESDEMCRQLLAANYSIRARRKRKQRECKVIGLLWFELVARMAFGERVTMFSQTAIFDYVS